MKTKLYRAIACLLEARVNCARSGRDEWATEYEQDVYDLVDNYLPSGSGFDGGTMIDDWEKIKPEKLVFYTQFHHMDENGVYDGWTEHTVTVTPSLVYGFNLRISGPNRNEIKDHIHDVFYEALNQEVER